MERNDVLLATLGGFGNHFRWLLLLDDKYIIHIPPGSTPGMLLSCPIISDIETKVLFIERHVYYKGRTAKNWIHNEWRYRNSLDDLILFLHFHDDDDKEVDFKKMANYKKLFLVTPPHVALEHYKLINPDLNGHPECEFINRCRFDNKIAQAEALNKNSLMFDSSKLYNSVLNEKLYDRAVSFFNLKNHYYHANIVHQMWYNLKEKIYNEA